jgi:hypothetical protein
MEISPISSFADDSPQALAANEQYPNALGECLEYEDWSFARRLVELPKISTLPEGMATEAELPFTYRLPGDMVKIRHVPDGVTWRIDETVLRADRDAPLPVRYTRLVTNEARLSALFRTAVALKLATLLAPQYVKHRTKRADLVSEFETKIEKAKKADRRTASADGYTDAPGGDWSQEARR